MSAYSKKPPSRRRRHRHRGCPRTWLVFVFLLIVAILNIQFIWLAPFNEFLDISAEEASFLSFLKSEQREKSKRNDGSLSSKKRYAYAFYATTSAYACGAFVQVAQLRDLGTPSSIDFVLL